MNTMNMGTSSLAMGDKERLKDGLTSQKQVTSSYNTFAGECTNPQLRNEFLTILKEEHDIQADIFSQLSSKGWYQTEPADQTKVSQAREKYRTV